MIDAKATPRWLLAVAAVAMALGIYARFKGLGTWPFGVDEYYIARSIDFVLSSGLPGYPCGGYYQRGILYQYIVAGLRLLEMSPEFAGRLVTAVSSLATLPAVWLLGRRLHGPLVGWIAVTVLGLSLWEVEMARFARMYAPFQAVFCWYLLYFLRYAVDRDQKAAIPMMLLSLLGVVTWEGGVLLAATNFLPALVQHQQGRLPRSAWIGIMLAVPTAILLALSLYDFRQFSAVPGPSDSALAAAQASLAGSAPGTFAIFDPWLLVLLLPLAMAVASLPWIWSLRHRWVAAAGLLLALLAALASQLLVAAALVLSLMLLNVITWRELLLGRGRWAVGSLIASLVCWTGLAAGAALLSGAGTGAALMAAVAQVSGLTDVVTEIVRPWGGTQPVVTALLGLGFAVLLWRGLAVPSSRRDIASLLVLILLLALAIGASAPPRHETRYSFFLYPLLVILAVIALADGMERIRSVVRSPAFATAAVALILFAVSEDFRPTHLLQIDSERVNFREGLSRKMQSHLYPRSDFRRAAQWLTESVQPGDVVVIGIPPMAHYYGEARYSFLDEVDDRYFAFACQRGTVDRWSNLPLLYSNESVAQMLAEGDRLVLVLYSDRAERLAAYAGQQGWKYQTQWPTRPRDIAVLVIEPEAP